MQARQPGPHPSPVELHLGPDESRFAAFEPISAHSCASGNPGELGQRSASSLRICGSNESPTVVPAKAGTHTPCRCDLWPARDRKFSGYGSPPSRGRQRIVPCQRQLKNFHKLGSGDERRLVQWRCKPKFVPLYAARDAADRFGFEAEDPSLVRKKPICWPMAAD